MKALLQAGHSGRVPAPPEKRFLITNPQQTDAITGTSQKMRAAHYQGLANRADAERYFEIAPSSMSCASAEDVR